MPGADPLRGPLMLEHAQQNGVQPCTSAEELAQQVEHLGREQLEFELSLLQRESNALLRKPGVLPVRQLTGEKLGNQFSHREAQLTCELSMGDQ